MEASEHTSDKGEGNQRAACLPLMRAALREDQLERELEIINHCFGKGSPRSSGYLAAHSTGLPTSPTAYQNKSVGDFFFLISVLLRSDLHMIDCIHSKCTVWIFTAVYTQWNLHHHQCAERSHHAQKLLSLSSVHPPSAPVSRQLWSLFFFCHDRVVCSF